MKLQEVMMDVIRGVVLPLTEKKLKLLNSHIQPKKRGTFFSKEMASAIPTDNKVYTHVTSHSLVKRTGNFALPPTSPS